MCRTLFVLLICRKLFLLPTYFLSVMIITMFTVITYDVVMLITILFLCLHIALYVRYFGYVLHCYFTCAYPCIHGSNLTLFLEPKRVEWQD